MLSLYLSQDWWLSTYQLCKTSWDLVLLTHLLSLKPSIHGRLWPWWGFHTTLDYFLCDSTWIDSPENRSKHSVPPSWFKSHTQLSFLPLLWRLHQSPSFLPFSLSSSLHPFPTLYQALCLVLWIQIGIISYLCLWEFHGPVEKTDKWLIIMQHNFAMTEALTSCQRGL